MKLHIKFFCFVFGILFFNTASAQRYLGIATSDWSATNALYLNPASIAGAHEKVTVSFFSLNLGVDNNLGTITKLGNIGKINSKDSNSSSNGVFSNSGRKDFSMILPYFELRGPGVLVAINKKMTVAVSTRLRVINQLNNFDQSLYKQVSHPDTANRSYEVVSGGFNWTADLWSEIGLSFGMIVMDDENGQIKVGATLRHLSGVAYLGFKARNLNLKYTSGSDSFYASRADLEFASNIITSNNALSGLNTSNLFNNMFGSAAGGGFGADLGAIYTRSIDIGTESHKISGSLSITDIGSIKYTNTNFTANISGSGYLTGTGLSNNDKTYDSLKKYATQQGFKVDTGRGTTKMHMPTAFIIGGDYQVYKRIYVNALFIANLVNRQIYGNTVYNQLTITPRYDSHVFTAGLPITYSALSKSLKMGLGLRLGGFFMGSDDMLALMSNNQYGFNFYFGACVPIAKKEHKMDAGPASDQM